MTHPVYTESQLQNKKLEELKAIAPGLGAVAQDKRSKQSWIDAIVAKQPQKVKQEIKTCADCQNFKSHNDGTNKGWCCLFDRFARESHTITQDCINSSEEVEQVDDYLFHDDPQPVEQPVDLPHIGDTYFIDNFLLRCVQLGGGEYATIWDVFDGNVQMGRVFMDWRCLWTHNMSLKTFATPQEATIDLYKSARELIAA